MWVRNKVLYKAFKDFDFDLKQIELDAKYDTHTGCALVPKSQHTTDFKFLDFQLKSFVNPKPVEL